MSDDLARYKPAKCVGGELKASSIQRCWASATSVFFEIITPPDGATHRFVAEVPRELRNVVLLEALSWEQLALLGALVAGVPPSARSSLPIGYKWHQAMGMPTIIGGSHERGSASSEVQDDDDDDDGADAEDEHDDAEAECVSVWRRMCAHFPGIPLAGRRFRKMMRELRIRDKRTKVKVCQGTVRKIQLEAVAPEVPDGLVSARLKSH